MFKRELYSEILDHKFTITVSARALDLIDAAYGFDFYILKVRKGHLRCDQMGLMTAPPFLSFDTFIFPDTKRRLELQVRYGPKESHVTSPGPQEHRALPR